MQSEINSLAHAAGASTAHISILGINAVGQESDNALICQGHTIPWLQDVPAQDVWTSWNVTWRDVVILDRQNHKVAVYNLTEHDLSDTTNFATLKALLLEKAAE